MIQIPMLGFKIPFRYGETDEKEKKTAESDEGKGVLQLATIHVALGRNYR